MSKLKQIIRLHCQGVGSKSSHKITGVARRTIREYVHRFQALRMTLEDVEELDDLTLHHMFFPALDRPRVPDPLRWERLQQMLPALAKDLRRKGMTFGVLYLRYLQKDSNGYSRTRFYIYLREYRNRSTMTMHIDHKAGDKMFVDFCGDKLHIWDPSTGEQIPVEVFVSILGCSQLTYVEAVYSQKKEDFIGCCQHAFEYFGGVTSAIVPDNLKAAVTKSSKYEPMLNETFETFAEHYGTVVLPARSYKPKDKALVENAVRLVYMRIYAQLKEQAFTSLKALNEAILVALDAHNARPLKQDESRRTLFENEERKALRPLPALPYEMKRIKEHKVMKNGHVALYEDRHYYSVPYELIGKSVRLVYDSGRVEIFYMFKPVARHPRSYAPNRYTTNPEHLAGNHRFLSEWNPEFFINKARQISPEVVAFIEKLLESKRHPEQGYKACSGVLSLDKRVGRDRLIGACRRALEFGAIGYHILEDILKKGLDKMTDEEQQAEATTRSPNHQNLRGKEYYQDNHLPTSKNNKHE